MIGTSSLRHSYGAMTARFLALWITLFSALVFAEVSDQKIGRLIVFGDSLSDDGGDNSTWFLLKTLNGQTGDKGIKHMAPFVHDWLEERVSSYEWLCDHEFANCPKYEGNALSALISLIKKTGTIPISPRDHYDNGRWSNGLVWPEYLARNLKLVGADARPGNMPAEQRPNYINDSHAGSWSLCLGDKALAITDIVGNIKELAKNMVKGSLIPPCLELILKGFLYRHKSFQPDDFVVVFYGGNDYLNRFQNPLLVVDAQSQMIEEMIDRGAKHIAWLNMPDLSPTPRFSTGVYSPYAGEVSALIDQHNLLLRNEWQRLSKKHSDDGVNLTFVDASKIFTDMMIERLSYGLIVDDKPCSTFPIPGLDVLVKNDPVESEGATSGSICSNPDEYVFWDTVHPSSKVHKVIADKACELLRNNNYVCESD